MSEGADSAAAQYRVRADEGQTTQQQQAHGSVKEARMRDQHAPSSVSGLRRSSGKRVSLVAPPSAPLLNDSGAPVPVAVCVPRADPSTVFAPGSVPASSYVSGAAPSRPHAQLKKRTLAQLQHGGGISAATRAAMGLGASATPLSSSSSSSHSSHPHSHFHPHAHAHGGPESPGARERNLSSKRVKGMTPSHEVANALAKVMNLYSPMPQPHSHHSTASSLHSSFNSSIHSSSSSSVGSSLHSSIDTAVHSSLTSSLASSAGASVTRAFCDLNVPSDEHEHEGEPEQDEDAEVSMVTPATCASSAVASSPQESYTDDASDAHHRALDEMDEDAMDAFDEEEGAAAAAGAGAATEELDAYDLAARAHAAGRARAMEEYAAEEAQDAADCIEEEEEEEDASASATASAAAAAASAAAATAVASADEEFACGESLDDDVVADMASSHSTFQSQSMLMQQAQTQSQSQSRALSDSTSSSSPSPDYIAPVCSSPSPLPTEPEGALSSPRSAASLVRSLRFSLPPSAYRSYHPRCSLIVSVETALAPLCPDLEAFMWGAEQAYQPYPYYINYQTNLEASMRPVLLSWMMEVAGEYCLGRETVHLAINYIDRFLTLSPPAHVASQGAPPPHRGSIDRTTLQLLGVTALFVAAKVEEIHPPSTEDMADTTAEACTAQSIFEMERALLHVLDWRLHPQTPFSWLKLFVKKAALELYEEFKTHAQELFTPAAVAAAAEGANGGASGSSSPDGSHAAHQRFSLLQLSFLQELEGLLSSELFVRMMELLDVLLLDMHSLRFYPSQLAAAVLFLYHAPGSPMFGVVSRATGYEYTELAPALSLLLPFADMPYVGLPGDSARTLMMGLNIPHDELYGRHVSNPHALPALDSCSARFAEEVALCHTNVLRSIPPFLAANVYEEMGAAELLVPIRNRHCHRTDPALWNENPRANHLDPRGEGSAVAAAAVAAAAAAADCNGDPGAIEAAGRLHEQALQASRAREQAERAAAAAQAELPPVVPASESFLAAAGMPYQRLPANAPVVGGGSASATMASSAAAVTAPAKHASSSSSSSSLQKGGVTFHTSGASSAAAAGPAGSSAAGVQTLYTFGEGAHVSSSSSMSASSNAAHSASALSAPSAHHAISSTLRREWTDSSDDEQ